MEISYRQGKNDKRLLCSCDFLKAKPSENSQWQFRALPETNVKGIFSLISVLPLPCPEVNNSLNLSYSQVAGRDKSLSNGRNVNDISCIPSVNLILAEEYKKRNDKSVKSNTFSKRNEDKSFTHNFFVFAHCSDSCRCC